MSNESCPKCGYTLNVFGGCLRCDGATQPTPADEPKHLACPKCGKTFPLYMVVEFGGHTANCKGRPDCAPEPAGYSCPDPDGCKAFKDMNAMINERELQNDEKQEQITTLQALVDDYEECAKDKRRLTKTISDILHPNGDGPEQPALCDIVAYVRDDFRKFQARIKEQEHEIKTRKAADEMMQALKGE